MIAMGPQPSLSPPGPVFRVAPDPPDPPAGPQPMERAGVRIAVSCRAVSSTSLRRALAVALVLGMGLTGTAAARPHARLSLLLPSGPVLAGDAVLLRGRLSGAHHAGQPVIVAERLSGRRRFTRVARARTDARGRWLVVRRAGAVLTDRLVHASAGGASSRVAALPVQAELSLAVPAAIQPAGTTIAFTGTLTPRDPGAQIELQELTPGGNWRALRGGRASANARFRISVGFPEAGQATLRVLFAGDRRAQATASAPVSLIVEQAPLGAVSLLAATNPVAASPDPAGPMPAAGLSGTVSGPTGARRLVTLFARTSGGIDFPPADTTTSDGSGGFAFSPALNRTTAYAVRAADGSLSGQVIVGVLPTVTVAPLPAQARAGGRLIVAGMVSPPIGGFPAELQRQGRDGGFHTIARGNIAPDGSFRILGPLGAPGPERLRVLIAGGSEDLVSASVPVALVVSPPAGGAR